jgi:iron(III) transport system permease protein
MHGMATADTAAFSLARGRPLAGGGLAVGAALLALCLVFVAWPLLRLLAAAAGSTATGPTLRLLGATAAVAAVSTALALVVVVPLAWTLARTTLAGRAALARVLRVPLVLPPFLAALALVRLGGPRGFWGIVLAQVVTFLPHAALRLSAALAAIDPALEEAAENLGAGAATTLRRVTLALLAPALASTALAVFALGLADFADPFLVGDGWEVLATAVTRRAAGGDLAGAALAAVVLALAGLVVWLAESAVRRRFAPAVSDGGTALPPTPRAVRWPLGVVATALAALVTLPALAVIVGSIVGAGDGWSLTLAPYAGLAGDGAAAVAGSVAVALVAGVAGTAVAFAAAYLVTRRPPPGVRALAAAGALPRALPGIAVGAAFLLAFGRAGVGPAGLLLLAAAIVAWRYPLAAATAREAFGRMEVAAEEAAVSLGAGGASVLRRVVAPLVRRPALSVLLHVFVQAMATVSTVILLAPHDGALASPGVLARARHGDPAGACALATGVLAVIAAAIVLVRALGGRDPIVVLDS